MISEVKLSSISIYSWWFADELDMTALRGQVYKRKSRGPMTYP